jgi:NAD(P)-dependent dehydrogenase (short-subunit alcohol dehydrogenase family)
MDVEGKLAVITGGGGGLGRELAFALSAAGARCLIADVDLAAAEEVAALIRHRGIEARAAQVDVGDDQQAAALVELARSLGGPHILVNNAGGWGRGERQFPHSPSGEWSGVLDVNLRAPMLLTQLCLQPMRANAGGVVVNVASSAGIGHGGYDCPEYAAAKAGLIRLTTSLAGLRDSHDVRVACVVPDWIGLPRAVEELAAMSPAERASKPPLIPPLAIVEVVLGLVADDTESGTVVELWGGQDPIVIRPDVAHD